VIQREHDGVRWELQPDFAPLLEALLKTPGETVKESRVKRVSRHQLGGQSFYIKRYFHHAVPLRPLKFFFKATQARQEWTLAQQLEARRIPIVRHVALGERRTWSGVQESLIITEGFEGAQADEAPGVDPLAVLRFVEFMHEQGVVQEDLHLANLLVRQQPLELRLVDLHGARVRPRLSGDERRRNLALLRIFLPVPVPRDIEVRSRELRKRMLHSRSWRCLRNNREFAAQRHGGLMWRVRLPFVNEAVRRVLDAPDAFLNGRATMLKAGRTSTVGKADGLVLKRFNFRKVENLFKDLFRPSRARRAFRKAYHLELAGVPTARPIAAAQRRVCGILLRSYLLMEEIAGAVNLSAWLRSGPVPEPALVRQAAQLVARLHDEGFSHRDLKLSNLALGADGRLCVLDLDGLQFQLVVPDNRIAADLERLDRAARKFPVVTAAHRRLFLRAYCKARRLTAVPRRESR
jgi:tRNA A-37 threonylcarbamoyl transferase component Bud32